MSGGQCRNIRCRAACAEFLCATCGIELSTWLDEVPWLIEQLAVTELRRDRISRGLRTGSAPVQPLPFDDAAADLRAAVESTVITWTRHLCESHGLTCPARTAGQAARWMSRHVVTIRHDEAAGEIHRDIRRQTKAAVRAINPPEAAVYRGPCPSRIGRDDCAAPIYGPPEDRTVVCATCGAEHDVARLEARLLARIGGSEFSIRDLVLVLRELGQPVPRGTIASWISRGQLRRRGTGDGEPVYRLDDVRKLRAANPKGSTA